MDDGKVEEQRLSGGVEWGGWITAAVAGLKATGSQSITDLLPGLRLHELHDAQHGGFNHENFVKFVVPGRGLRVAWGEHCGRVGFWKKYWRSWVIRGRFVSTGSLQLLGIKREPGHLSGNVKHHPCLHCNLSHIVSPINPYKLDKWSSSWNLVEFVIKFCGVRIHIHQMRGRE